MNDMDERALINEIIGENILKYRMNKMKSQEELAFQAKIDEKHLGMIERGKKQPGAITLHKIALALDVTSDQLLDGTNDIMKIEPFEKK